MDFKAMADKWLADNLVHPSGRRPETLTVAFERIYAEGLSAGATAGANRLAPQEGEPRCYCGLPHRLHSNGQPCP